MANKMNKKCMSKVGAVSVMLALTSLLITVLLILFVSATNEQYTLGEKVKIDIGEIGEYTLEIKTPTQTLLYKSTNSYFAFQPETTGEYSIQIKSKTTSKQIKFEVTSPENKPIVHVPIEEVEYQLTKQTKHQTPNTKHQITVGLPVTWKKEIQATGKDMQLKIPESSTQISLSGADRETDFKVKKSLTDRLSNLISDEPQTSLIVTNAASDFEVKYTTPAPEKTETEISETRKEVKISSEMHYKNVLAYTDLPEQVSNKNMVQVYWKEESKNLDFELFDKNNDGLYDYVEWTVSHLSDQNFEIIIITKAEHLDENRELIADIYNEVQARDDTWTSVFDGEYIRVVFEKLLDKTRDITVYARSDDSARVEVYEKDGTEKIADFGEITSNGKYQILLNNLVGTQDTFDLLVKGGTIEFDYIVDPVTENFLTLNLTDSTNNTAYYKETQTDIAADPAWDDGWDGAEVAAGDYTNLEDSDDTGFEFIASGGNGREPFTRFNFTINVTQSDINWIQISMKQRESGTPTGNGEHCYYYVANFAGSDWESFGAYVDGNTYITRSSNLSTISNYINGNQLVILSLGTAMEASALDGCDVDYVEVKISYNISTNDAPTNPTPTINSTSGTNLTDQDLNCFDTLSDLNGDDTNVSVRWYKDDALELTIDYNNTYADGYNFKAVLDSGNTTSGDSWICSMKLHDGANFSSWVNSSTLNIISTDAPVISSISPSNNSNTTNPITLSLTTDVNADCEFSTNQTFTYGTGIPFSVGQDSKTHSTSLGSLSKATHTYYIKCEDSYGNANTNANQGETTFHVVGDAPTHSTPFLNSTYATNYTTENLTCYNQSTSDSDSNPVKNIITWKLNGTAFEKLNMPFEGGSTPNTTKDYALSNDGTVIGATYTSTSGYDGLGSYSFDGSNDFVNVSTDLNQWLGSTATLSFWIKTSQSGSDTISLAPGITGIEEAAGNDDIFWGYIDASGDLGFAKGDGTEIKTTSAINDDSWHHVAITRNSTSGAVVIYVDGTQDSSGNSNTGDVTNSFYSIGRIEDTGATPVYFDGNLDEIRVYDRVLTAQQVGAIYSNNTNTILSQETLEGETWQCAITPNDGYADGQTKSSNSLTIIQQANLSISILYPENTTYNTNVTELNYSYYDDWSITIDTCWYNLNGAANITTDCSANITSITSTEGNNTWNIYYNDSTGREASASTAFQVDATAPSIALLNQTDENNLIVNATHPLEDGQNLTLNINITDATTDSAWITVWESIKGGTEKVTTFFTNIGGSIWQVIFPTDNTWRGDLNYTIYANDSGNLTDEYDGNFSMLNMDISIGITPAVSTASENVTLSGHINLSNGTDLTNHPINIWLDGVLLLLADVFPIGTYDFYQNFTDTSDSEFDLGAYTNMTSDSENLSLSSGSTSGEFTKILDAGARVEWDQTEFNVEYPTCAAQTLTFQEGDSNSYASTQDSYIDSASTGTNHGTDPELLMDAAPNALRSLIRFDDIIGSGTNQIASGSTITEANITIEVFDLGSQVDIYEILENWTESQVTYDDRLTGVTWGSNGITGAPSRTTTAEDSFTAGATGTYDFDITTAMQRWSSGTSENYGVVLDPTGGNGVSARSSEFGTQSQRPLLTVSYIPSSCTEMNIYVRLSNDKTTWTSWQSINTGENISDSDEAYRYLEYKVEMSTESSSITPDLKDIMFNYTAIVTDASADYTYNLTAPADGGVFNINVTSGLRTIYGNATTQLLIAGTPSVPVLNAPENSSSLSAIVELNWTNSIDYEGDTVRYILAVDNDSDFFSPVYFNSTINETATYTGVTPSNITDDDTYFWRVRAYDNSSGNSSWSEVWQFTLDTSAPNITFINQTDDDELIVNATHPLKEGQNLTLRINVTDNNIDKVWIVVWDTIKGGTEKLKIFFTYVAGLGLWVADIATDYTWGDEYNYTIYANDTSGLETEYDGNFSILKMNATIAVDPNPIGSAQDINISGYINFTNSTYLKNYPINLWFNGKLLLFANLTSDGSYNNYLNFSDTSSSTFDSGTYTNTTSNSENLTLSSGSYSGNYTRILDAGAMVEWNNLEWQSSGQGCSGTNTYQDGDSDDYSGTRDTYIDGSSTGTNYGTSSYLNVDASPVYRALIKFEDVIGFTPRGIPDGATINTANITIEISNGGTNPTAYEILENWTETQATYTDRLTGIAWTSDGCAGSPSRSTTAESTLTGSAGTETFDITNAMQSWTTGTTENYGIVIHPGGTNGLEIRSSEYSTQSNSPLLSVSYTATECTDIKIYTRLSNDKLTWTDWQEITSGASINDNDNAYRYLEYRADLSTTDNSLSPSLEQVTANYTAITTNATGYYNYVYSAPGTFGNYELKVNTSYGTIYTEATTTLQVQSGVDPVVTLLTPATQTWFNYTGFNVTYNATDANFDIKNATLIINGAQNASTTSVSDGEINNFTVNFGSGQYNWTVNVADFTDNVGADTVRTFYIDLEDPVTNLISPPDDNNYATNEVTLSFNATDNLDSTLSCDVILDGSTIYSGISATNGTQIDRSSGTLADGPHYWNVTCLDESGRTHTSPTWIFNITDLPPEVTLVSPEDNYFDTDGNIDFIFNATDDLGFQNCSLIIDGAIDTTNQTVINNGQNTTINKASIPEGSYNWTIGCYDLSDSYTEATIRYFDVDLYSPQINLNLPADLAVLDNSDVNLNFTVIDSHDSTLTCNLTINGVVVDPSFSATNGTLTNRPINDLTDGVKYWNVTCSDDASHTNTSETRSFNVSEIPTVILNTENETSFSATPINLTYTPSDNTNLSTCSLYLDGAYNQSNSSEVLNGAANNFTLTDLSEGSYTWYVNCSDYFGLNGISTTNTFYIDGGAPNVTLYFPNGENIYSSNVTFNFTVEDSVDTLLLCNITVDGNVEDTFNASNGTVTTRNISEITDGYKEWFVNCSDSSGNIGSSTTQNFTKFSNPSVVIISPPDETWFNYDTLNLTYYVEDDEGITNSTLVLNGAANQTNSTTIANFDYNNFTLNNYPDGQYDWSVNVTDVTGLVGSSDTWTFYIDTQSPQIITYRPNQSEIVTTNNVSFNFTVTDNVDSILDCNISIDGDVELSTTATSATNTIKYILVSGGDHTWNMTCMDEAGNLNTSESIDFTIIAPPIVTLESPADNNRTPVQDINFTYTPSDPIGITKCDIYIDGVFNDTDGSISENQLNNFSILGIPEGQHNWTINCTDFDGDTAQPTARTFYVDLTPPSIELASPEDNIGIDANNNVLFNWTATDALDNLLTCDLVVDGNVEDSGFATSGFPRTESISGLSIGEHIWNVTCTDQVGNSNTSETRTFNYTYPDFYINETLISISEYNPTESETITINATIHNLGGSDISSVGVKFYNGDPEATGVQIGSTQTISLAGFSTNLTSITWDAPLGDTTIFVIIDFPDTITELNETNNKANKSISVESWHFFYGSINSDTNFTLTDSASYEITNWNLQNLTQANIYAADYDSSIEWLHLQAIGKTTSGTDSSNDIQEIDTALSMTAFADSHATIYLNASSEINETLNYTVFASQINYVPVATSINSTNFKTGILWDTSDDSDSEYDTTEKEDIIYITSIQKSTMGSFEISDYELRVPAKLREYNPANQETAVFYIEII